MSSMRIIVWHTKSITLPDRNCRKWLYLENECPGHTIVYCMSSIEMAPTIRYAYFNIEYIIYRGLCGVSIWPFTILQGITKHISNILFARIWICAYMPRHSYLFNSMNFNKMCVDSKKHEMVVPVFVCHSLYALHIRCSPNIYHLRKTLTKGKRRKYLCMKCTYDFVVNEQICFRKIRISCYFDS